MKSVSTLLAASVVLAGIVFPAAAQLTLSLTPTSQTTGLGGEITYNLGISGLKSSPEYNGPALGAFSIVLDFNSGVASGQSAAFGTLLSASGADFQSADWSTPGQLSLTEISYDSAAQLEANQTGSFVLGSFTLEGMAAGSTPVTFDLGNTSLSDEFGNSLTLSGVNNGSFTVSPVPEPGTLALASLGLGLLAWQVRRRVGSVK